MEDYIIEISGLSKSFNGVKALDNVDFCLKKGEIRCLAGENGCGKSTLVKLITGAYTPDDGHNIKINNNFYKKITPKISIDEGIQVIWQDLSLFEFMTVSENIAIGNIVNGNKKIINKKNIDYIAKEQLNKLGVSIDTNIKVSELSVANKQIVAICRALSQNAKVIFMDEPTTALTKNEVDKLLDISMELKKKGISIVFISHKLDEVFKIADNITVIRDSKKIGDFASKELDSKKLSYHMTGKNINYNTYKNNYVVNGESLLKVEKLTKDNMYRNISFELNNGDILGMIGILGSGRTELALSIFGLNGNYDGNIYKKGKKIIINSPQDAIINKISLLPENRLKQGLFLEDSQKNNITATVLKKIASKIGFISDSELNLAEKYVNDMNVNSKDINLQVGKLSGGNQQKVVLGKCLAFDPDILILDSPTVGIDIGSKYEIYEMIQERASNGMGIILISDEIDEILANCNKIAVFAKGKIIKYMDNVDDMDSIKCKLENIMKYGVDNSVKI